MSESSERTDSLVDHLEALAVREDRATLALLRASLGDGRTLDALGVVLPFVTSDPRWRTRAEDDAMLLAGLFALHPESGGRSLPTALAEIARTSESVELRFRALLGANRADLPTHLRHAVALAASHKHPVDWRDLHRAIRCWEHEDDIARRQWARDFWNAAESAEAAPAATP